MTGLADVDGFKISIQVCVWPRFPPLGNICMLCTERGSLLKDNQVSN